MVKKILEKILSSNEEIKYQFSLGERYLKISKTMTIIIGFFVLSFLGIVAHLIFELDITVTVLVAGILLGLLVGYSFFYFGWFLKRANIYLITDKRIIIHKGWLSIKLISVDFQQITDIKVIQPFFEKVIFRTGTLKVNTAGMEAHPVILPHIENPYKIKRNINERKHFLP